MNPLVIFTRSGRKLLDILPQSVQPQAWRALEVSHLALFRVSGRRLGTAFGDVRFLFLHHFGAKSGVERVSPLVYVRDGDRLVLIASKGGDRRNPAWLYNLKAHPDVRVEMHGEVRNVKARVATGDERKRLWKKAAKAWPDYERYQARVPERKIPVVVLEPRA
jgi:deazaflavin-dependent oxidoreductase (nitroreductase family)